MSQMYAIVYRSGPQAGDARSFGTVVTGDDPDGPPFDAVTYEKIAIDHQPGRDEMWDKVTKSVIAKPAPPDTPAQILLKKSTWNAQDNEDAIREILKRLS